MFVSHGGRIWWEQEMRELGQKKGLGNWYRWDNLVSPWATGTQFAYTFCTCSVVTSEGETGLVGWGHQEADLGLIRESAPTTH